MSQSRRPARCASLHKSFTLWPDNTTLDCDDWKHVTWSDESRSNFYRTDARVRYGTTSLIITPQPELGLSGTLSSWMIIRETY
ncbi:hypothetical protein AVEN_183558-1 [Araneus ventricosus]|uniref:Uncharacterized protein n=1 Tax=Araneus ventricosus TaxID=182803 RepID=A0A4Y2FFA3_ARAVE|nr:hypothetical protein AVEN_183558-1 [Araneus ventricosus]